MQPSYLVRSYLIGLIFFALIVVMTFGAENRSGTPIGLLVYAALSTLLFPFAKLVWDELRDLAFGNNIVLMNAIFLFMLKLFINLFLWAFAIFVAPLGILYLWFRSRQPKMTGEDQV